MEMNDVLRGQVEELRLKLKESDKILESYKSVLTDEIDKKKELRKQLNHLKLVQEYGYDEDENFEEMKMKMDDLKMLLQEKNLALKAQKDINLQLMEQLQMNHPQKDSI